MPGKDPTMFQRGQRAQPDAPAPTAGTVRLRIRRYDPDRDPEPHWETYQAPRQPGDRLLDALHHVKWYVDGSLSFRRSCAHGVCGSDAMRVNGVNRLACKVLLKDLGDEVRVEPIQGLPLAKDLIVDMDPFFASYRAVMPYLIAAGHEPTRERLQPPEQRDRYDDTTKCILCAAGVRLEILKGRDGVFRCRIRRWPASNSSSPKTRRAGAARTPGTGATSTCCARP